MVQSCGQLKGAVGACGDEIGTLSESAYGAIADCLDWQVGKVDASQLSLH